MSKKTSELAAQVAAINRANAVAAELFPVLTEIFRPLVGEAVVTKPGPLTARVTKLLPVFPNTTELSVYRHSSDYSLAWTVSARESYPTGEGYSSSVRHECTFYIGDLDHQVLTKLCESYQNPPTWRTRSEEHRRNSSH